MEISRIRRACAQVLAEEKYEMDLDGTTWCNLALNDMLVLLGFKGFAYNKDARRVMTANEIVSKLDDTATSVPFYEAGRVAMNGHIVIAGLRMPGHGHVALLYPSPVLTSSGKWTRMDVPFCANVGKVNGVIPLNWAFGVKPNLWMIDSDED